MTENEKELIQEGAILEKALPQVVDMRLDKLEAYLCGLAN